MTDKHHRVPNLPDLDAAIDRAVRDLLSAEPRAGMRQRVLDRLTMRSTRILTLPRLAAAVALAALIVLVVSSALRRQPTPETTIARPQTVAPQRETPAPQIASTSPSPQSVGGAAPRATPVGRTRKPDISAPPAVAAAAGRPDRRVEAASIREALELEASQTAPAEPLPLIPPIGIAAIEVPAIVTSEIAIKPLTMEPIPVLPVRTPR